MIKAVYDPSELVTAEDHYSGRIVSALNAYGTGYSFCRFFTNGRGSGLLYNSSAVFCGDWEDTEELEQFILINSPVTAECPPHIPEKLDIDGYEKKKRLLFEIKDLPPPDPADIVSPPPLDKMFEAVNASFGGEQYDLWYADMSHRIRHGVSRAYMYREAAFACVEFIHGGRACISQLAVIPQKRGNGFGRELLGHISHTLGSEGISCYLFAYPEAEGYYRKTGFEPAGEDIIYIRK